jgi:adenine-specific DNA-methyltransferase
MATGVPKKRRSDNPPVIAEEAALCGSASHLTYAGKKPEADVLATTRAQLTSLWTGGNGECANRLYFGDNLPIMARLLDDPAVRGKVRLVYIDPPFATQTTFHSRKLDHAYEDTLAGADFIESLRWRLILLRNLMAPDGSIYLHLDEKMVFHLKVVMDEIFGPQNFRNCVTRKKCNPKNYTRKKFGNISDYILFYTKSDEYVWNKPVEPWTEARAKEYQYVEAGTGRRYMKVPLHAPGVRHGETGKPWRGVLPPPGKHWQFPPSKLDEFDARGEIFWSANGNPRRKVYLDGSPGIGVQDIWMDFRDAHNQNIRVTGYPTEKNPDLLRRIIEASSNPGDLVLDGYSGSGTSLAVSSSLNRNWIGIDNSPEAIRTTLQRFAVGAQPMGSFVAQRRMEWQTHDNSGTKPEAMLFGEPEEWDASQRSGGDHSPIRDFVLMSETCVANLIAETLQVWQHQWTQELTTVTGGILQ